MTDITSPRLESAEDVRGWFDDLLASGISFHPEDGFGDIVELRSGRPAFTRAQAVRMDEALARTFGLVDDPSRVALEAWNAFCERLTTTNTGGAR